MEPILPHAEHRPVPWTGFDVLLMFSLWIVLTQFGIGLFVSVFTEPAAADALAAPIPTTEHPLSHLLEQGKNSWSILLVAFFSGVILSPLTEEFLFRLLFQGWLSKRLSFLPGLIPILAVSVIFAAAHAGTRTEQPVNVQFYSILGVGIVNLAVFCFGVLFLRTSYGVTFSELGFQADRIVSDLFVAAGTFILTAPFILGLHAILRLRFPDSVTDPIPLFLFSILLGILYYRSNRLFPCFSLHALLNGFSFSLIFLRY